jgi:hypothetical protein
LTVVAGIGSPPASCRSRATGVHVVLDLLDVLREAPAQPRVGETIEVIGLDLDDQPVVSRPDPTADVREAAATRRVLLEAWPIHELDIHPVASPRVLLLAIVFASAPQVEWLGSLFAHPSSLTPTHRALIDRDQVSASGGRNKT